MAHEGVSPDFIVTRHAWVYARRDGHWRLHVRLSLCIQWRTWRRGVELARLLRRLAVQLSSRYESCRITAISPRHYRLQFRGAEEAAEAHAMTQRGGADPAVRAGLWQREVELRSVPCAKAVAVLEVARQRGVTPAQTLAIGDGRSDLGMLLPNVAAMTGCPLNATHEVVQAVLDARGHVATAESMAGALETVRAWLDDRVSSVPPPAWHPPRGELGLGANAAHEDDRLRFSRALEASLIAGSLGVALVALDMASGLGLLGRLVHAAHAALRALWSVL